MIQRRIFLGSVALGVAQLALPRQARAATLGPLNWQCEVVKTKPHTRSRRSPVVTGVDVRSAADLIAVVGDDHAVCIYDIAEKEFTCDLINHTDWVRAAQFSPNGQWLATAGNDRRLLITSMDDLETPAFEKRHPAAIISIAWSNDGSKIATVGFDQKLRVFNTKSGEKIGEAICDCNDNHAVAFSDDDSKIAAGGRSGDIQVWTADSFAAVANFKHHRQRVRGICFTADGHVLSVGDDQIVALTDPKFPATAVMLPRQSAKLFAAELLGENFFATGGSDNKISIWNLGDMSGVGTLTGHTGTVSCMAAIEGLFVSGSFDTTVRIWKPELDAFVRVEEKIDVIGDRQTRNTDGWRNQVK